MRSLLKTRWIRALQMMIIAAVTFPVAGATIHRVQQERVSVSSPAVSPPLVHASPLRDEASGTVVDVQAVPAVLIARLDAPGFPPAVTWQVAPLDDIASMSAPSDPFTVVGTAREAPTSNAPSSPPNWSGILATLLLVGFFVFRRVL